MLDGQAERRFQRDGRPALKNADQWHFSVDALLDAENGHPKPKRSGSREEDSMVKQATRSGPGEAPHGETLRSFSAHAIEASRELIDKGADVAGGSGHRLKARASGLPDEAKELAEKATETIKERRLG